MYLQQVKNCGQNNETQSEMLKVIVKFNFQKNFIQFFDKTEQESEHASAHRMTCISFTITNTKTCKNADRKEFH